MRTLKLRIKDKHANVLIQMASEANFVWNYVNELGFKHLQRTGQFFSAFDMAAYTKGASKSGLNLHSQTIQAITEELVRSNMQGIFSVCGIATESKTTRLKQAHLCKIHAVVGTSVWSWTHQNQLKLPKAKPL